MEQVKLQKMDLTDCQQAVFTPGRGVGTTCWQQNSSMLQAHKKDFSSQASGNQMQKLRDIFLPLHSYI